MKKLMFTLFWVLFTALSLQAQQPAVAPHRIVFQLQSADTLAHKSLMKQLNNIATIAPDAQLEVVCHGPGLQMLIAEKSKVAEKLTGLTAKNVNFLACEFSMQEQKVTRAQLLPVAETVQYGLLEVVAKQEAGWSYIKAGF
jgi:uncharacterized protein